MSSVSLPHDLKQDIDPATSPTPGELFAKDDLEFRTITTLLNLLAIREPIDLDNFHVSRPQRPHLKLLTALSSLLVRRAEVITVMPKRSVLGTTIFVGSEVADTTEKDFRDDESTSSGKSTTPHDNFVTRSPEKSDPVGAVRLLESPIVEIGSDILAFILKHWQQSFDHHVQSFANLLNKALANPDDDNAREALNIYSFFQSTRKTYRRFTPRHSPRLNELFGLHPRFNAAHVPSLEDQFRIRALLSMNPNGIESHSVLHGFLGDPPVDEQQWLPVFHSFFVWFLRTTVHDIKQFSELRDKPDPPTILPRNEIKRAYHNLAALKYFSWNSVFFAGYISAAFAPGTVDRADSAAVGSPDELGSPGEKEHQNDEGEDDMGLDIPTEFETGEESIPTSDHPHRCIRELRLAGSNIQNLNTIFNHAPRCRFRFQVIQYPPAGNSLKPWRHLVQELFPEPEVRNNVVQSLADLPGTKFAAFRPGGSDLKFEGQAHCVAVLGCLFSLTKRREDTTWTGIPQSVLQAISTCYSVLAHSKRCCPVCATIVSLLSEEAVDAGGSGINALSRHSVIFPCALPIGLPSSIRRKLLTKYRRELRVRLTEMVNQKRGSSNGSAQGAALSRDGDSEVKPTDAQKELLGMYQIGWEVMDQEARCTRWREARQGLAVAQLMGRYERGYDNRAGAAGIGGEAGVGAGDAESCVRIGSSGIVFRIQIVVP